jgi:deoxyribodipyrimidine photo-lyase
VPRSLPDISVVLLKRDLRLRDHEPLQRAILAGRPLVLLYCFEPSWMASPDADVRHWRFLRQGLDSMNAELAPMGKSVTVVLSETIAALESLAREARIVELYSHEETGNALTFARDRLLARFCAQRGISWYETPTGGVTRRLSHRAGWEQEWLRRMEKPLANPDLAHWQPFTPRGPLFRPKPLPDSLLQNSTAFQPGGELLAQRYLQGFLLERSKTYFQHISKPTEARKSCSRLSPYLTFGALSMRQVWQATRATLASKQHPPRNLQQFSSRLFWHCHFIQKFESESRIEFVNMNRGFDSIRRETNAEHVLAWEQGRTGIPLVDACQRCVQATGYLNFRMRSMLVSFLTHQLWQPWQAGVHHLARQFLDYEPGIHFAQFQMQAGTTGVNTFRIYNPTKQALDHDPEAHFIKRWIPELAPLPTPLAIEPWKLSAMEEMLYGVRVGPGGDYPAPIVDLEKAGAAARDRLWAHQDHPEVLQENQRILFRHTKRTARSETAVMGDPKTVTRHAQDKN